MYIDLRFVISLMNVFNKAGRFVFFFVFVGIWEIIMNSKLLESPRKLDSPSKKRKRNQPTITEKSLEYFEFEKSISTENGIGKNYYKCTLCKKQINGTKENNLASHLRVCNISIYSEISGGKKDPLPIKRLKLLQNCTEIVTVNGRPFRTILDSGFQKTITNKLNKLNAGGCPLNLSHANLSELKTNLQETAKKAREKVKIEVKGRVLGLMVDIVTKNHRSLLGASVQYACNGKLIIRHIALIELHKKHAGKYLAELIMNRLKEYGIEAIQILSITTDNGSNVLKMIRDLNEDLQQACENITTEKQPTARNLQCEYSSDETIDNEIEELLLQPDTEETDMEALEILFGAVNPNENTTLLNAIADSLEKDLGLDIMWNVTGINCAEHTLQLAIKDALESMPENQKNLVKLCRKIAKFLRLASTSNEMREMEMHYNWPHLENDTRWCSTYLMVNV